MSEFHDWFRTIATAFVGIGAFLIAYRQWKTAQNKLKLDLYDRRFAIFNSTIDLINAVGWESGDAKDKYSKFKELKLSSNFLLPETIRVYLEEIRKLAERHRVLIGRINSIDDHDKRNSKHEEFMNLSRERDQITLSCGDKEFQRAIDKFKSVLGFEKVL